MKMDIEELDKRKAWKELAVVELEEEFPEVLMRLERKKIVVY